MAYRNRLRIDAFRTLAFGAIGVNYGAIGAALTEPCRIFILNNLTDADIFFSLDGATNQFILPPRSFKLIDVTANKVRDDGFFVSEGTIFYARHTGVAPTLGAVYIECIHA